MPARPERGFTLMEAAIAIAVIAILAGTAIPFALKNINQAREQRVRQEMKLLFEACFGASDRVVANMRNDWGYDPGLALGAAPVNLGKLTNQTVNPAPTVQPWGPGVAFNWGWNGPYWSGATALIGGVRVPADPWGRAYLLRRVSGAVPGYQILCTGSNGVNNTPINNATPQTDDLVYPPTPMSSLPSGQVVVTVKNANPGAPINVTVHIWARSGGWTDFVPAAQATKSINPNTTASWSVLVPVGGAAAIVTPPSIPAFTVPVTVGNGELRSLDFTYN